MARGIIISGGGGAGGLLASNNLSDLANPDTARGNLGMGIPSRLYIVTHSYGSMGTNPWDDHVFADPIRARPKFTAILPELLGMPRQQEYLYATVPSVAAGSDATTFIGAMPQEGIIEQVTYIPASAVTGANTNSRTLQLLQQTILGPGVVGNFPLTLGVNLVSPADVGFQGTSHSWNTIVALSQASSTPQLAFRDANNNYLATAPSIDVTVGSGGGPYQSATGLWWKSLHVGTGIADPGGFVIVRLSGRQRNVGISGAQVVNGGPYGGGWGTALTYRPLQQPATPECFTTALANAGATSITVQNIYTPFFSGDTVQFNNGVVATLTATPAINATTLTCAALSGSIPAGSHGATTPTRDSLVPTSTWCILHGVNDGGATPKDASAFRECVRSIIAAGLGTNTEWATAANHTYTNGGGTWAEFAITSRFNLIPTLSTQHTGAQIFTGATTSTPNFALQITAPSMDGDTITLMFYALVGASHGAKASILVDGANPPAGACTIDTSSVATGTALTVHSITGTTTNGSPNVTVTVGTVSDSDIGRYVTGPGVAANTVVASITDTTHFVLSQNAGAAAGTGTINLIPLIVMVKRLTGLSRKTAHTITCTMTGIDATDGTAALIYGGYLIEGDTPRTPVCIANVPKIPNKTAMADTCATSLTTEITNVIAGTATANGTSSVEPALPSSVVLVDIDTPLGSGNQANFTFDGIHPNTRGMMLVAKAFEKAIRATSELQMAGR